MRRRRGRNMMKKEGRLTPVKLLGCEEEEERPGMDIPPIIVTGGIFKTVNFSLLFLEIFEIRRTKGHLASQAWLEYQ